MRPLTLRTTLSLSYAAILALLLTGLALGYYRLLARQLELDATAELEEVTSALHGYLDFDAGMPSLVYDRNDPEEVAFIEKATRYYQIYDASSGACCCSHRRSSRWVSITLPRRSRRFVRPRACTKCGPIRGGSASPAACSRQLLERSICSR